MTSTLLSAGYMWLFIVHKLWYISSENLVNDKQMNGDENIVIDLTKDFAEFPVQNNFQYSRLITDEQIKLFQMDEDKLISMWNKIYPELSPFKCVVLKGNCGGTTHLLKLKAYIHDIVGKMGRSRPPKNVQLLLQTLKNNDTRPIKWTPAKEYVHPIYITRTHTKETTGAWLLEAGTTLHLITPSGLIKFESEWAQNRLELKSLKMNLGDIHELTVLPNETIETYITYQERQYILELTYFMTIDDDYTVFAHSEKGSSYANARAHLRLAGKPTEYNHTIIIKFADVSNITQVIKKY